MKKSWGIFLVILCLIGLFLLIAYLSFPHDQPTGGMRGDTSVLAEEIDLDSLPEYSGEATIEINDNVPDFEEYEIEEAQTSYESYSELDALGRCGKAEASVSLDTIPTKKRTSISSVKPSGWENEKYDFVSGEWVSLPSDWFSIDGRECEFPEFDHRNALHECGRHASV